MSLQRRAADLFAERVASAGRPITVTFQVTDRCNYRCAHCYQEHTKDSELSFAEIDRIFGELAELGVLFLTLMGGEFFMRRDADDILRAARGHGFAIKLLTTGHHINDRRADLIAEMRPIQIDMSLYAATSHRHEEVTRQPGSFDRTLAAAKRLIARRVPVQLKAPVMESNAADLGDFVAMAKALGAECSMDAKITTMENTDDHPVTLRMTWKSLAGFYRSTDNGMADFLAETYGRQQPTDEIRPLHHTACGAGSRTIAIDPQGLVYPCNSLPVVVGDLTKESVAEVWYRSTRLDDVRQTRWADIAECNVCELRRFCQRCHGMALLEHGRMRGPSLEACRHAVAVRDSLRDRGLIAATETALPPTWDRVDVDGQHQRTATGGGHHSAALRVIS
ncbi:MAG TPA: radical SAM protein [Kofleriaceae bacterium]|nr:radical SAM protein [Kofleriaceae bacterium]